MRPVGRRPATWVFDAAIVVAGLLTIGLLVFSTRLTSTTLDQNSAWDRAIASVKLHASLADIWLQQGVASKVRVNLDAAETDCASLPAAAVTQLCAELRSFRASALQNDPAYAAAFARTLQLADTAQHTIALRIAHKRRTLNRINAGTILLVLLVFAGMAAVVARRVKQLAAHNERLRRVDRLKDDFIAAVSHELRTPLTSTIGFLQTLERGDLALDAEQRLDMLRIARLQAQRLSRLVDDLLFFAESERGRLRLDYTEVDLAALSEDCVRAQEPLAQQKGIALRLDVAPLPPVHGDRGRLAQLLDNLLSNALKFTPDGGSVEVRARATGERALLEVADTGIGIPPAEQPHLFDRFFRTPAAVEQAIPGAGIGLSIVKAIADAHNGVVTVRSDGSGGTTVRVELPLSA